MRTPAIISLAFYVAMLTGCTAGDPSVRFMAVMDAKPPGEQLPNWSTTKALMMRQPPKVGDLAPDFSLKARDNDATTMLSSFRGDRPVVLIFGSWT